MLYFRSILTVFEKRAFSSVTLNGSVWITHIVTPGGSPHRSPPRSVFRPLVAAPRIDAWLRCAGPDQVTMWVIHTRSEGSVCMGVEMLRCAQHDRIPLSP